METCTWILLAAGLAATAARLSWRGTRATWIVAAAWATAPWLTSDLVSNASAARLFARASSPDRVGGLAALVIAEALAGGWEALRGTSFAAPLVAARLVRVGSIVALAAEARPGSGRVGRGIVCGACAIPPKSLGVK